MSRNIGWKTVVFMLCAMSAVGWQTYAAWGRPHMTQPGIAILIGTLVLTCLAPLVFTKNIRERLVGLLIVIMALATSSVTYAIVPRDAKAVVISDGEYVEGRKIFNPLTEQLFIIEDAIPITVPLEGGSTFTCALMVDAQPTALAQALDGNRPALEDSLHSWILQSTVAFAVYQDTTTTDIGAKITRSMEPQYQLLWALMVFPPPSLRVDPNTWKVHRSI